MTKVTVTRKLDDETADLLRIIAGRYFEGNESLTLRVLIREEAQKRKITLEQDKAEDDGLRTIH